jgi:hypothetical protein
MSVNKHLPHVFVLPEDDANGQLANGFQLDISVDTRRMQILNEAGGWCEVFHCLEKDHLADLERYTNRFMVLLLDFDRHEGRFDELVRAIPPHLRNRVFILGVWSEPEDLRKDLGRSLETIGLALAKDCRDKTDSVWAHPLLSHNATEVARLREFVAPFLFKHE